MAPTGNTSADESPVGPSPDKPLRGCRVLVVDDNADARDLVECVLAHAGAKVCAVASASDARSCLQSGPWDLVVTDICMPDEDGWALLTSLRATGNVTAVIAHSAAVWSDDAVFLKQGFAAFVPKPLEPSILVAAVLDVLRRAGRSEPDAPPPLEVHAS